MAKAGRNDPCPCGSGKKHKHCCLAREGEDKTLAVDAFSVAYAHHQAGRLDAAVTGYEKALSFKPDFLEALNNLAAALQNQGRFTDASVRYEQALRLKPNDPDTFNNLGSLFKELGRLDDAIACYERAIRFKPDFPEALNNLGNVFQDHGRLDDAIVCYERALRLKPGFPMALNNFGSVLQKQGKLDAASACYEQALRFQPDYPKALYNLGSVLREQGKLDAAIARYQQALRFMPDDPEVLTNLGVALCQQGRLDEATACYEHALRVRPDSVEGINNLGAVLLQQDRVDAALVCYERALRLKPDFADAHYNESLARLLIGDFATGWRKYEWRWKNTEFPSEPRDFLQPLWSGESLEGKTILLHAEQGLGDTIQFYRYVEAVAKLAQTVILEVPGSLVRLLGQAGGVTLVPKGQPLPAFDVHCPLLSLPCAFATTLQTIPARIPYLGAEPRSPGTDGGGVRVGIVWRGSPTHKNDRNRSTSVIPFLELAEASSDATFFVLQKDLREDEIHLIASHRNIVNVSEAITDFADTAAIIADLDLVISVDTAVAHLTGAMGRPVWVLLPFAPDWRWMRKREDSPWYPTMRLFRQAAIGDWGGVFARVKAEIGTILSQR
ncbi:MAG: tetratricopeptide repeat protein [Alphaproteobacteria bacterium]|nr:tetratricopeptide repeat protein [Alphaproteobacteria bacterium]